MGEATPPEPPDPHFLFAIAFYKADSFHIWQVYAVALGNFSEYAATTFSFDIIYMMVFMW